MIDSLRFDAGNDLEGIGVGPGLYLDDDEFGARCLWEVVKGLLFGRVADGGYDCGVCTTEVSFQQGQTEAAVGARDEDGVRHVDFFGKEKRFATRFSLVVGALNRVAVSLMNQPSSSLKSGSFIYRLESYTSKS